MIENADQIWFAVMGPDTTPTGEENAGQFYQSQLAKSLASFLGLNYVGESKVGEAVASMKK